MYELPTTVMVEDREYQIRNNADYRLILDVISACQEVEFNEIEKVYTTLILFYDNIDTETDVINEFETPEIMQAAMDAVMDFISGGDTYETGNTASYKLIDWKKDEKLIVAGINPLLGNGMDIRRIDYMHWWTFLSYYMGIGESALSTVVSIRDKIIKGKKLEKYEQTFRREHPEYFKWREQEKTENEKQLENDIMKLWQK